MTTPTNLLPNSPKVIWLKPNPDIDNDPLDLEKAIDDWYDKDKDIEAERKLKAAQDKWRQEYQAKQFKNVLGRKK